MQCGTLYDIGLYYFAIYYISISYLELRRSSVNSEDRSAIFEDGHRVLYLEAHGNLYPSMTGLMTPPTVGPTYVGPGRLEEGCKPSCKLLLNPLSFQVVEKELPLMIQTNA